MKPDAILETVIYGDDIAAMERFYGDVLGLELHWKAEGHTAMFRCGRQMLLIFNPAITETQTLDADPPVPAHGARGAGHVCFAASRVEIERWQDHLEANGIAIEAQFEWPRGGYSLYFRDPAGNSVEFAEPRIWGFQ
jgi:catechol 2,3-dioxygenase-like lactoylglutathione lyase family enzyme